MYLVVLVLSILVVLVHHQFDERDSAGFCCLGEETSSRKTLLPDLPLNYNPPPHHYDIHLDYSPPPSQKIKSPFFALPCSQLQSCLGNLDRLELASAVVVLLVARHRQVARLGIGIYKISCALGFITRPKVNGWYLVVLGHTPGHCWELQNVQLKQICSYPPSSSVP